MTTKSSFSQTPTNASTVPGSGGRAHQQVAGSSPSRAVSAAARNGPGPKP
ncbi:MAG: hypothetical protein ACRCZD_10455 [Phycicoccus sp.]